MRERERDQSERLQRGKTPTLTFKHRSHAATPLPPPPPLYTGLITQSDLQTPVSEEPFGLSGLSESHCEGVEGDVGDGHLPWTDDGSPNVVVGLL